MLHDKANWPTINIPSAQGLQYPPHMVARQQAAAVAQMQAGASPMKNNMPDRMQHRRGPSLAMEPTLEEEEDVSRGDILDFMTPRDISRMRYEQHHEWMEEILSSPFAMKQIVPTDLGLGRKGELEALTSDFFDAPTSVLRETSANTRVGRMEDGTAAAFATKAAKKVAEMEAELVQLKKRHARRMAKVDKASVLTLAEKRLRISDTASRSRVSTTEGDSQPSQPTEVDVDESVREVEAAIGKKVVPVTAVVCLHNGGLEEKAPTPKFQTPSPSGMDVEASASFETVPSPAVLELQQQSGPESPQASPPTTTTVAGDEIQPLAPTEVTPLREMTVPSLGDMNVDIEMAGIETDGQHTVDEQVGENDGSEWVMVDSVNATTPPTAQPPTSTIMTTAIEIPQESLQPAATSPAAALTPIPIPASAPSNLSAQEPGPVTTPIIPGLTTTITTTASSSSLPTTSNIAESPTPHQSQPVTIAATTAISAISIPAPTSDLKSSALEPTTTNTADHSPVGFADDNNPNDNNNSNTTAIDSTQPGADVVGGAAGGEGDGAVAAVVEGTIAAKATSTELDMDMNTDMTMALDMNTDMNMDMDLGDMDDSAFGGAFHPPEEEDES
jgi:hypothetical protein